VGIGHGTLRGAARYPSAATAAWADARRSPGAGQPPAGSAGAALRAEPRPGPRLAGTPADPVLCRAQPGPRQWTAVARASKCSGGEPLDLLGGPQRPGHHDDLRWPTASAFEAVTRS